MEKMFKQALVVLLMTTSICGKGYSPHVITLFFKNYPLIQKEGIKKAPLGNKNQRSGIFVSYFGYMTNSDKTGSIVLPRKHQDPKFSILVCNDSKPIFMLQNTIHHWEVKEGSKFAFYTMERKKDDQTKLYFWDVKKDSLPENKHLPVNTLVIFADPEDIYVPEGISLTNSSPQLLLPSIYVKKSINTAENALAALDVRSFFDSIERTYKAGKAEVQSQTNML